MTKREYNILTQHSMYASGVAFSWMLALDTMLPLEFGILTYLVVVVLAPILLWTGLGAQAQLKRASEKRAITSKKEEQDGPYVLKEYLDYQFLADLEHEFEMPHSSNSFKACANLKCIEELRELDAIMNGEDEKPATITGALFAPNENRSRNVFEVGDLNTMSPEQARSLGYSDSCVVGRRNMDLPLEVQSYHHQANAELQRRRHMLFEQEREEFKATDYPPKARKKFYPLIDTELREQIEGFYGPGVDYEIDNIMEGTGGVVNQHITTPDGSFMRVAWDRWYAKENRDRWYAKENRDRKRRVEIAMIDEQRQVMERLENELNSKKATIILPPESGPIITPIAPVPDPDILEPEMVERLRNMYEENFGDDFFGRALKAMQSYHGKERYHGHPDVPD